MARTPSRSAGRGPASGRTAARRPANGSGFNYPRAGKGPVGRWLPSWRVVLGAVLTVVAVLVGLFAAAYATTDVPEPDDFALAESTTVYYADGETPMGSFSEVNREVVPLEELPDHVAHAVIASEDRRFYENPGVDPKGLVRALWNNVRGLPTQGGSTLTQQYVENYYTGTVTSYVGKFRETILALKIDRSQSKDEILGNYLNTIYFGRGAYGIEKAADAYFGKPAAELTISESALLAGIIPSPSNWDPAVNPEKAEQRWNRVLDFMVEDGWITQEERDAAQFPQTVEPNTENIYGGPTGYLLTMVRNELVEKAGLTEEQIDTLGLDIITTIDKGKQDAAVQAVADLPEDRPENNHVALVSIDPATGGVVALYGGADYVSQPRNNATQDRSQAGSMFKPFALVAGLENGKTLEDTYTSYSPMDINGYTVRNYDFRDHGVVDLVEATAKSINTAYVQLNVDVGPQNTLEAAVAAGIPEDTPGLTADPSNVLGPSSPHAIDLARAYSTFAAQGVRHDPYVVGEVRDTEGSTVYTGGGEGERVFEPQVMADATYAMTQVVERGTAAQATRELGRPAAGKTGTSNDLMSAGFAGYVPQLATVVTMYQVGEDGGEESLTGFGGIPYIGGGQYPAQIWTDYMVAATEGMPVEEFPERSEPVRPTFVPRPEPTTQEPTEEPTTEEPTEEPTTPEPTQEPTQPEPTEEPLPTGPPTAPPGQERPTDGATGGGNAAPGRGRGGGPGSGTGGGPGSGAGGGPGSGTGSADGLGDVLGTLGG